MTDVRFEHVNLFFVHWLVVFYLNYMIGYKLELDEGQCTTPS